MYKLTLTSSERKAIDWVGYRYSNGDDLYYLLTDDDVKYSSNWDSNEDITFHIPEYIAWQIADNARQEDGDFEYTFPCFDEQLTSKLVNFCMEII